MRTGTVKQFDNAAGYGFIDDDLTHSSYFVFFTAIKEEGYKSLTPGERVRYQLAQGKRGLQCINVYIDKGEKIKE